MRRPAALFLLAVVALTGACSPERPAPPSVKPAAAAEKPRDGGRIVRRLESDVDTLNYLLQTTDYERNVLALIHDPLIDLDASLQPIPGVAAKWEVSPDGLTYTLHLDPRATFSDGTAVTARDVLFTLRKVVEAPSQQFAGFFEGLDLARSAAVDDRTVRVAFNQPLVPRWYAFNIAVLPEHVYGKGDFTKDHNETSVGTGPYTLVKREPGQRIQLERRAGYWREQPHIQTVVFRVIGDHTVAWNAMKLGEIDEMRVKSDVWAREHDRADVKSRMRFEDFYWLNYNCIAWNNSDPILGDVRV
ncbi:MAG TPA: ABC transporter substrate-binding protein, partial [Thermoanaerobaculia bacterium]